MIVRPPPPGSSPDEDRDTLAWAALRGPLTELRDTAVAAGWSEPEIMTALLSLVIGEIRDRTSDDVAIDTLLDAIDEIER